MNILEQAFHLASAVEQFSEHARTFYYDVVLAGRACPQCGGDLRMAGEGRCRCLRCTLEFNPTIAFQSCAACGGEARLSIRRYSCRQCGQAIPSLFLFDGLVFDADYFRQKMAESRQRRRELTEQVRQMLAGTRSGAVEIGPMEFAGHNSLMEALNALAVQAFRADAPQLRARFDLRRYQTHIQAHTGPIALAFDQLPPLSEDRRLDRIWRFIAIIFLAHEGLIHVWQEGPDILVSKRDDAQRSSISGELEDADGLERPVGRVEA